jgi:hypothetical protein
MAAQDGDTNALPPTLLRWVVWTISGEAYEDRSTFENEVHEFHPECNATNWRPAEVVLRVPRLFVTTDIHRILGLEPPMVELTADDGHAFTAGELLFKIHNALLDELRDTDHVFFEGLALVMQMRDEPPIYEVVLGS